MPYLCQADVIKRRNWNLRRVKQFLCYPDSFAPNPKSRKFREMLLYDLERIRRIEASPEFQADLRKCLSRRRVAYESNDD